MESPIALTIILNPNGTVSVSGPINNLILCYGLLESAKDALKNHIQNSQSKIEIPKDNRINKMFEK